jgi:hypothetical protein
VPDKQQTFEVGGKPHMGQRAQVYPSGSVKSTVGFVEVGAVKRAKVRCHAHPLLLDYLITWRVQGIQLFNRHSLFNRSLNVRR